MSKPDSNHEKITVPPSPREQQLVEVVQYALQILSQMPYQQVAAPIQQIQMRVNEVMTPQPQSEG